MSFASDASPTTSPAIAADLRSIARIDAVPTILQTVAHTTGMRFTAVARVTDEKWVACAVYDHIEFGLKPGGELVLESTICNEIRQHHQPVIFGEASKHPVFATHQTTKMYGIESYISIPIFRRGGEFFGTLCAIDPAPAKLDDPHVRKTLELFARLIGAELDAQDRLEQSVDALLDAQQTAKLREQFIAVLGHDLRNPLMAIQAGADLLQMKTQDARSVKVIDGIHRSVERMGHLINDILDFARGRLGSGIPVVMQPCANLSDELRHLVAEVQLAHPDREIRVSIGIGHPVACDARRLGQLLVNLLGNAMHHGAADQPVEVSAHSNESVFELAVSNGGQPIPAEKMALLFHPFTRGGGAEQPASGLGLGLYIASEIAKAHGGTLQVSSTEQATRFVFSMPVTADVALIGDDERRESTPVAC